MASINQDPKSQVFRIRFRFGSVRVNRSLKTKDRKIAQSVLGRVEETLRLIEHGRLEIPPKVDPATFILRDGRIKPVGPQKQLVTLKQLFKIYQERLPATAKAPTTIALEMTHIKNFLRLLPPNKNANLIGQSDLQRYVEVSQKRFSRQTSYIPSDSTKNKQASTARKETCCRHDLMRNKIC